MNIAFMLSDAIREKIEKRFGKPIRYSRDCEALSLSIARACQERVSTTTLKRLFGFAKEIEKPRKFTMDVVAKYAGYTDWEDAIKDKGDAPTIAENQLSYIDQENYILMLHEQLSFSRTKHLIQTNHIVALCEKYGHLPAIIPFITEMITVAEQLKHITFIKEVFSLPNIFNHGQHNEEQLYAIGQAMGFVLRRNPALTTELVPLLASNPYAQQYLIEWFVDEEYLSGYYGLLLDLYHLHRGYHIQDKLFYYALKYNQALVESDAFARKHRYEQIRELNLNDTIYCIPAARYAGIRLSEEKDKNVISGSFFCRLMERYVRQHPFTESVSFTFFCCRQLFASQRDDWMAYLTGLYLSAYGHSKPVMTNQLGHKLENGLYIYLAYGTRLNDNKKLARELISRTDPGLFPMILLKSMNEDYAKINAFINA
jgi:hypothetical protein